MSGKVIYALVWLTTVLAVSGLVWLNSRKFRSLYPQFRSGPFWAMLTATPVLTLPPVLAAANTLFGTERPEDSWPTFLVVAIGLSAGTALVRLIIPGARQAVRAYDQHLMKQPVTGRWSPEKGAS